MKTAVVGGGILGLTLSWRLSELGHDVELFEAESQLGGLACPHHFGDFIWDKFYHCVLPQDSKIIGILEELGIDDALRWVTTGTGYYGDDRFFRMNGNKDFIRFPLLSFFEKGRLGAFITYTQRFADPYKLYDVTAKEWLTKWCGENVYRVFWEPLLKAKFGPFADRVAAVFIWATLTRLFGARKGAANKEKLGYISGGYKHVLDTMSEALQSRGVRIHLESIATHAEMIGVGDDARCCLTTKGRFSEEADSREYDQVFFTAPTHLARKIASGGVATHVDAMLERYPTATHYLGVVCLVLALKRPLTEYYILNIGDPEVELTGVIEMTNLVDTEETAGQALVYLPRYLDSEDPALEASDDELYRPFIDRGLKRLFPQFDESEITYWGIHRARYVQPLPLVREAEHISADLSKSFEVPELSSPFQLINTSMMRCATLNNNEVVALVDEFVEKNRAALTPSASTASASTRAGSTFSSTAT